MPRTLTQGGVGNVSRSIRIALITMSELPEVNFSINFTATKSYKKIRKAEKIRNRYNQVPQLTQDTTWESDKNQLNITNKSQEVSPFPAVNHVKA